LFKKFSFFSILAVVIIIAAIFTPQVLHFLTDFLWFGEVGYRSVFITFTFAKFIIAIAVFFIIFFLSYFTLRLSTRYVPDKNKTTTDDVIDITAENGETKPKKSKKGRMLALLPSLFLAAFAAFVSATSLWDEILMFLNQTPAGITDPIFGRDLSFYFFNLSLFETVYMLVFFFFFVIFVFNLIMTGYLQGFHRNTFKVMGKRILYFLITFFVLLSFGFVLQIFNLLYSETGAVYGAGYVDLKVTLPMYLIAAVACLLSAVTCFIGFKKRIIRITFLGPVILVGVLVIGTFAQGTVEKFVVYPSELSKETPYIEHNIQATNTAYGLDNITESEFSGNPDLTANDLSDNHATLQNVRITDYRPTKQVLNQLQVLRYYYTFSDVDIDRYDIDDTQRQIYISARELDQDSFTNQTWINKYLKYTHGYGVVVTPVNEVTSQGQPELWVKDLPPVAAREELTITRPEIYFGEKTNDYVIVNSNEPEFDYPVGDSNAETFYQGNAGINMNLKNRILFTLDRANYRILFSNLIDSDSRILLYRNINERVQKIAPFLIYDNDPYLVITDDGRLIWMMDAYTASDKYPYSEIYYSNAPSQTRIFNGQNYVRNSVKITIDAYNGDVNFYIIDQEDPIIQTYANIFPALFQPIENMPQDLRSHIQYSTELFQLQTEIYQDYHMKNVTVFYNREDSWSIATEIYGSDTEIMEPYYINMCLPGEDQLQYILIRPFTAYQKGNMVAWLAVGNDGDNYGDMTLFKFPKQSLIYGPMQIESRINNDSEISQNLSLWNQQGSSVIRSNLLVIPINHSLLYIEPIYLTANTTNSLPEVIRIVVSYDDKVVMAKSLDEALEEIFGYDSTEGSTEQPPIIVDGETITYDELVRLIKDSLNDAKFASQNGDWAAYGAYLDSLEEYINRLNQYSDSPDVSSETTNEPLSPTLPIVDENTEFTE